MKLLLKLMILLYLYSIPGYSKGWEISVGVVIGASSFDSGSSWGKRELNPILGRGTFGKSHLGRKIAITGVSLGLQGLLINKDKRFRWPFMALNIGWGVAMGVVGVRNYRLR